MKPLKFVHIPKTGGTSIEDVAIKKGIRWGRFHKAYGWHHGFLSDKPLRFQQRFVWFTVVRNPYTRLVSEFYCPHATTVKTTRDVSLFNSSIAERIRTRSLHGDHWVEQYKYLNENIKHILRFETLVSDFNALMELYQIPLSLHLHHNKAAKVFGVEHLFSTTIALINEVYAKDFEVFDYAKL